MRVPLCLRGIGEHLVRNLLTKGETRRCRRGELLFRQGDPCDEIVLILEGTVKLSRLSDDGGEQTVALLGSGDCYCVTPVFLYARYPVTAQCLSAATVLRLSRKNGFPALQDDPRVAAGVVRCLIQRVEHLTEMIESLSTKDVRRRLAQLLLTLGEREGMPVRDGAVLDRTLTHQELAACVGTAREVVSRLLAEFRKQGAIRNLGRRLVIADRQRLERIASGSLTTKGEVGAVPGAPP
jgi:CRP/FNR family transcriptional regulator